MAQRDDALAAAASWSDDDEIDVPALKRRAVAAAKATPNSGNTASLHGEHSLSDDTVSALLQATQAVDSATKEETPVQTLPAVPVSADWPAAAAMPSLKLVLSRVPAQKPLAGLSDSLLSCAVSKLATTTTHPQCGLIPAACLCAMSQPAAVAYTGVAVSRVGTIFPLTLSLFDDDDPRPAERLKQASGGAVTAVASRKRGRHGDLFEESDSDADDVQPVPPRPGTRAAQNATMAASVPIESLASRLGAQHSEFAAIAGCLAAQRAEVARADKFLTWMCSAMSAVTA